MKTLLSTEKPKLDVNDKFLPHGNFSFCIKRFTEQNTIVGEIRSSEVNEIYEFRYFSIIQMMAKSQARLARRVSIANIGVLEVPSCPSPSNSPSIFRNVVIDGSSPKTPRTKSVMSPKITRDECTICLEGYSKNMAELLCGHNFHYDCIKTWYKQEQTCPVCRKFISDLDAKYVLQM